MQKEQTRQKNAYIKKNDFKNLCIYLECSFITTCYKHAVLKIIAHTINKDEMKIFEIKSYSTFNFEYHLLPHGNTEIKLNERRILYTNK